MDDLVRWLGVQLDEDERIAREASDDSTGGDQWEPTLYGDDPDDVKAWGSSRSRRTRHPGSA